ncbi:Cytochrome c oxidase subunit 6, mitochondrial [Smittium culicis]|uniref:Cytochrome c oxidase subunit 6, mitochondrial n=1 Tax=Smittium culicis TaxID=133412 RepID=A0A1R1XL34_9FUNG|nr:Cytochrome c oxidase subunit 6, mitochondrial [Smittium culicis]
MNPLRSLVARNIARPVLTRSAAPSFAVQQRRAYSGEEETYEQFTTRYVKFFENVDEQFELRRGLNNCFSYDLVPDVTICEAALRAARRINDYSTGVRVFDAIKSKVETNSQYVQYLDALKPVKDELGILTKEEMNI